MDINIYIHINASVYTKSSITMPYLRTWLLNHRKCRERKIQFTIETCKVFSLSLHLSPVCFFSLYNS